MKVYNVHERRIYAEPHAVGEMIDRLSGVDDMLWPRDRWPAMEFDVPLRIGARGGHGPVRYHVSEYIPGRRIVCRFDETGLTGGLDGRHLFEIVPHRRYVVLRHIVDAECDVKTWMTWHMVVRPLHDALLEDSLDGVETRFHGTVGTPARWGLWVRTLRWLMARRRRKDSET